MTLQAIQQAVGTLFGHMPAQSLWSGLGYAFVIIGIAMLLGIAVVGGSVLLARGVKAIGNMTPGSFVALLLGIGVVFILVGVLLP